MDRIPPSLQKTSATELHSSGSSLIIVIIAAWILLLLVLNEPFYASVILAYGLRDCSCPQSGTMLWYLSRLIPLLEMLRFQLRYFNGGPCHWSQSLQCLVSMLTNGFVGWDIWNELWQKKRSPNPAQPSSSSTASQTLE